MNDMNRPEIDALMHVLGSVDGTLEPQTLNGPAWQADQQAKSAYRESGAVLVSNPGHDPATRKAFDRSLDELEAAGLIHFAGRKVGLTSVGDRQARELAGLPTLDDAVHLLAAIARPEKKYRWSNGAISESSLCGLSALPPGKVGMERTPSKLVNVLTSHLAPLLVAGLVIWRQVAGLDGVLLFGPATAEAAGLAKSGDPAKWYAVVKQGRQFTPPDTYSEAWNTAYNARQHATPLKSNLIHHLDPCDPPRG